MSTNAREVLALMFEWSISLVVLIGGGFMLYQGRATEFVISAMTTIIVFWFSSRQQDAKLKRMEESKSLIKETETTETTASKGE